MCEKPAVSKEHIPPKCVFPEQKDTNGKNYRRDLITVPSCDIHNSAKTKDDEYLMMVLTSYFDNNSVACDQISSKVARAWAKSPRLSTSVVKNLQTINTGTGHYHAYEVDRSRFDQSLSWVANGLYYYVYRKPADPPYKIISYPLVQIEGSDGATVNIGRANILTLVNESLRELPIRGENREIFWFQVSPVIESSSIIRMCFFEGFQVVAMSSPNLEV
jgi:hypothetical protein